MVALGLVKMIGIEFLAQKCDPIHLPQSVRIIKVSHHIINSSVFMGA